MNQSDFSGVKRVRQKTFRQYFHVRFFHCLLVYGLKKTLFPKTVVMKPMGFMRFRSESINNVDTTAAIR